MLSLRHANSAVERSLSDNNNTVHQTERNNMFEETIISLRRMKEDARSKRVAENVVIYESMLHHKNDAKRKDGERLRKEKEAMEDGRRSQKQKEEEKENIGRYNEIKKDIGRKKESYFERGRKIG